MHTDCEDTSEQKPGLPLRLSGPAPVSPDASRGGGQDEAAGPWGFWATVGFSVIIAIAYILIQVIVVVVFAVVAMMSSPKLDINQFAENLPMNGFFQTIAVCAVAPFTIGLIILFAKIRRKITIKQYLGFHNPGWKKISKWCVVLVIFVGCFDALTFFINRPVVPEFMVSTYTTAYFRPLLWLAFVIVAPLSEEMFFRGFLFKGIENSKMGPVGAIIITSLVWAAMHTQYDVYSMVSIFVGGLLLGFARIKSNSIYTPIAMHIIQNIIATVEVAVFLRIVPNAG